MHDRTIVLTLAIAVSLAARCAIPAFARDAPIRASSSSPSLTLADALAGAATLAGSSDTASALEQERRITRAARPSSAVGLSSAIAETPKSGAPPERTLTEQVTLDIGSRERRLGALRATQAGSAQAFASAASARFATAQGIVTAFFAVASDRAEVTAADESAALAARSLTAATERRRVGVAPRIDVERARSALATAEADVAASTAALAADRTMLAALVGRAVVTDVALPAPLVVPDQDATIALVLLTNPSVSAAAALLDAARASLDTARGALRSDVVVGAGLAVNRQGSQTSIGPALSLGILTPFASGLGKASVASARASTIAAQATLVQARRDAVEAALVTRTQALRASARLPSLEDALASAQSVASAELAGYRLGAVSSTDLTLAQAQLSAARTAFARARVEAAGAAARFALEIGSLHQ